MMLRYVFVVYSNIFFYIQMFGWHFSEGISHSGMLFRDKYGNRAKIPYLFWSYSNHVDVIEKFFISLTTVAETLMFPTIFLRSS